MEDRAHGGVQMCPKANQQPQPMHEQWRGAWAPPRPDSQAPGAALLTAVPMPSCPHSTVHIVRKNTLPGSNSCRHPMSLAGLVRGLWLILPSKSPRRSPSEVCRLPLKSAGEVGKGLQGFLAPQLLALSSYPHPAGMRQGRLCFKCKCQSQASDTDSD